jgi:hypothetical protein
VIGGFAVMHAMHLRADFPNHTIWYCDWAKYTDEGWYGNAAVRAHLFGNWYMPGDFNPAPAVPVWPFLEWVLFWFTGVTIQAARGLAVAFFFINLLLSYLLLRSRGSRWMALLALTLIATSPFIYCFSRLAILEPMLIAFTLAALNLGLNLDRGDFYPDDAHQNHRSFSFTRGDLGHRTSALEKQKAHSALPAGRGRRLCHHIWPLDGSCCRRWPAARLQIPFLRK